MSFANSSTGPQVSSFLLHPVGVVLTGNGCHPQAFNGRERNDVKTRVGASNEEIVNISRKIPCLLVPSSLVSVSLDINSSAEIYREL